jgi:hypothetical protein
MREDEIERDKKRDRNDNRKRKTRRGTEKGCLNRAKKTLRLCGSSLFAIDIDDSPSEQSNDFYGHKNLLRPIRGRPPLSRISRKHASAYISNLGFLPKCWNFLVIRV